MEHRKQHKSFLLQTQRKSGKDTTPKVNPQLAVELVFQELKRVESYTKRIEDATDDDYVTEVFQLNGFKTENELVDEAKN